MERNKIICMCSRENVNLKKQAKRHRDKKERCVPKNTDLQLSKLLLSFQFSVFFIGDILYIRH